MSDNETFLQAKVTALAQDFSQCYDALLDAKGNIAVLKAKVTELEAKLAPPDEPANPVT